MEARLVLPTADRWSIRARLRFSIVTLVTCVVLALSALHLRSVLTATLDNAGSRGQIVGEAVQSCVLNARDLGALTGGGALRRILSRSIAQDPTISNILVIDRTGAVVASATMWDRATPVEQWHEWQNRNVFRRAVGLLKARGDIALDVRNSDSPFEVRLLFSPERLRALIAPELANLVLLSLMSLLCSVLLATLVSRLVGQSLERLSRQIDLASRGEAALARESSHLPELATLENKIWWLGRQFSGARTDIIRLKSNVELMLRGLDEAVLVFGPDLRLQMAGEPAERLLARPRGELLGRSLDEVFPSWTGPGAALKQFGKTGQVRLRDQPVNLERTNLTALRLLMSVEPVEYGDGSPTGILITLRDAETRRQVRADLDLARRMAAIGRITGGVQHEIKNPLNAMMLHLHLARDKQPLGLDAGPELNVVGDELLRLDRVVKTLLDFCKPVELNLSKCDLVTLAGEVASEVRGNAEAQNLRVSLDTEISSAPVMADAGLLRQALLHVAKNGLEAMSVAGRNGGLLSFTVQQHGAEYVVSVCDEGPGIPPEIQDRIFNLYFTTHHGAGRHREGVGLALTWKTMMLHNGSITVESESGKGCCFRLGVPYFSSGSPEPCRALQPPSSEIALR